MSKTWSTSINSPSLMGFLILLLSITFGANSQINTYNVGQAFTCIAVDSNYNIWAGTNKTGLFLLDKKSNPAATQFSITAAAATVNIQALAADHSSNVWVGHSGINANYGSGGMRRVDINNPSNSTPFSPDRNAECFTFLARDGIATLSSASITVDKNGTVWSAHKYHDLFVAGFGNEPGQYIITPGSLSYLPKSRTTFISKGTYRDYQLKTEPHELPYPNYTCNVPITASPQTRSCFSVATGNNEVWVSVAAYQAKDGQSFPARLLKYDLNGKFLKSYDFASLGIPAGGIFTGIWVTPNGDVWVTTSAGKGFAVYRKGNWMYVNMQKIPCIFPAGTAINPNAIWGNNLGQVFIGTSNGLVVYRGRGPVNSINSYTRYNVKDHGLISDNIVAGVSEKDTIQWIATDKGIMRSDLARNFPSSIDEIDYTSCKNNEIDAIELQETNDVSSREDYHIYRLETEVCSVGGVNGKKNCNAEYVYKMMKENAAFTVPSPENFPYDNLSPNLLLSVTKDELNQMVANANAWQPTAGPIKYMWDILTLSQKEKAISDLQIVRLRLPFAEALDAATRSIVVEDQKNVNPKEVNSCNPVYLLYNSPNFIFDRTFYDVTVDLALCDNKLRSPKYDPVLIFADDNELTITNYAVKGHILNPGKIFRSVIEECGKVKVVTIGSGLNYCGNNLPGKINGNGNVIGGTVIFKNVDFALVKEFEKRQ